MGNFLDHPLMPYVVAGGVVISSLILIKIFRSKKRPEWPKDTVILHHFSRAPWAPSVSPYVLKLETYLKMAKIPYKCDYKSPMSKKGKSPWISYNEDNIADSHFCIEYLNKKFNVDLNSHLTPEQKAIGRAFQTLVEDNLFWILCINRWFVMDRTEFAELMCPPIPYIALRWLAPRNVRKELHAQGMGRHTEDEVWHIAHLNVNAISTYLGKKKFLFGDRASEYDCTVFGMLAQFVWQVPGSPLTAYMEKNCPNLIDYCKRMKETFWPDWDDYLRAT